MSFYLSGLFVLAGYDTFLIQARPIVTVWVLTSVHSMGSVGQSEIEDVNGPVPCHDPVYLVMVRTRTPPNWSHMHLPLCGYLSVTCTFSKLENNLPCRQETKTLGEVERTTRAGYRCV